MHNIDQAQNMTQDEKRKFRETCSKYKDVFGDDLPGYNNYYGEVKASIQFVSKARPTPHKSRMPNYGSAGQKLYLAKMLSMYKKGILVDPFKLGIQPKIINDSWVVKKQSSAHKSWDECNRF